MSVSSTTRLVGFDKADGDEAFLGSDTVPTRPENFREVERKGG